LVNYSPNHRVKADGNMSEEGADRAGNKLARCGFDIFRSCWNFVCHQCTGVSVEVMP